MRCSGCDHSTPLISATPLPGTHGASAATPAARPPTGPVVGTNAKTTASVRARAGSMNSSRIWAASVGRTAGR